MGKTTWQFCCLIMKAGSKHSLATKIKMRAARLGKPANNKGMKMSDESRKKISVFLKGKPSGMLGKKHSEETKKKISASKVGKKMTQEHIKKCLTRRHMSTLEEKFQVICQKNRLPYKFVGNGELLIGRKNPDFVNTNGKKVVIEVYYTKHKLMFKTNNIECWKNERLNIFQKYGWNVIFFNEVEVNEDNVLEKLC